MFDNLLTSQGRALEATMVNADAADPRLMDEARADLKAAITKAKQANMRNRCGTVVAAKNKKGTP